MSMENNWIKGICSAVLALGMSATATEPLAATGTMEKCYGIAKKGMNDCAAHNHPCQGQSTKNGDPEEYLLVPKGTCKKIVNGVVKE